MKGSGQMQKASVDLPPVESDPDGLQLYFLTGKKYLYQTLFCIRSLIKTGATSFKFVLVDDGTFDDAILAQIARQLPGADIVTAKNINENLGRAIPKDLYPVLHQKRDVYPHLKKLTDIHTIPGNKWKLVLDSDMLFWSEPEALLTWLKQPNKPLYMQDCQNAYGYSKNLMETLCGTTVADLINVGAIGLESATINWRKIEHWITILEENEGTSYYLEQALTAMLIGESNCNILPAEDYIVNPDAGFITNKKGTLHHYVDLSKEGYFKQAWRNL